MVVAFDNHPTHWLVLSLFKGVKREGGNGLLFQAEPKDSVSRAEMLTKLKARAAEMGSKQEMKFSQIPQLPANSPVRQAPTHAAQ
jgi:hypothetical protein